MPAPVVTVPEPEDTHSHVDVHVHAPELKDATPVPVKTVAAPAAGGHDHAKDHDPEEGTNCLHVRFPALLAAHANDALQHSFTPLGCLPHIL